MNINNTPILILQNNAYSLLADKNIINKEMNKKPPVESKNNSAENELERNKTVNEFQNVKGSIINIKV